MTEFTYRLVEVYDGKDVDIPDSARHINYFTNERGQRCVEWLEKSGGSVQ